MGLGSGTVTDTRYPSVVRIFDYGVHAGYEYLAMEYLPRGDLKARMQQEMSEQDALHYVYQIAAALHVVHSAGLIHRDLKPPNVMLRASDAVALIDFGLAKVRPQARPVGGHRLAGGRIASLAMSGAGPHPAPRAWSAAASPGRQW